MAAGLAVLGGAAVGGGAYALDGQDLTYNTKTAIVGLGGAALGVAVGMFNAAVGAGIAGAGAALAAKGALEHFMAAKAAETAGMGRIPSYAYAKFGATPQNPPYRHMPYQLDAIRAELSGMSGMGAVVAELDAVEASLI